MKTAIHWLTSNSLVLALCLVALPLLTLQTEAATIRISAEPTSTTAKDSDLMLIDIFTGVVNGTNTYVTKKIQIGDLKSSGLSSNAVYYITNLVSQQITVSNIITTNITVLQTLVSSNTITTNLTVYQTLISSNTITTNLTVTQIFQGNKVTVTNITIVQGGGGVTNLDFADANSIVVTDPNKKEVTLPNGGEWTVLHGTTPAGYTLLSGSDFSYSGLVYPTVAPTNFIVNFADQPFQEIDATNDINFAYTTNTRSANVNWGGSCSIRIRPGGSDRLITMPTNWVFLRTNYLTLSGAFWKFTLTNASNGSGPRMGYLSVNANGPSPTNVVALFQESP